MEDLEFKFGHYSIRQKMDENFLCLQVWIISSSRPNIKTYDRIRIFLSNQTGHEIRLCHFAKTSETIPSNYLLVVYVKLPSITSLDDTDFLDSLAHQSEKEFKAAVVKL